MEEEIARLEALLKRLQDELNAGASGEDAEEKNDEEDDEMARLMAELAALKAEVRRKEQK